MSEAGLAPPRTVGLLVDELAAALRARGAPAPLREAREMVAALYDEPRFWPVLNAERVVDHDMLERATDALRRRLSGAPMAYAVGRAAFRNLTLIVDERVLIPRPETEQLVEIVLDELRERTDAVAVDVGTGSAAIALALAVEGREQLSRVYATDVSRDALAVARRNVELLAHVPHADIELRHGSLLGPVGDVRAHVIVSNPPYIAFGEADALPSSVRDWEPAIALLGGSDGLAATRQLVRGAADLLEGGGLLALEVDVRRASLVAELAAREPRFETVSVELDLTGRERFVLARRQERRGDDRG